jgi:hypothetical protein
MANTRIQQALIVVLATLVSACSAWTGPRAGVEDRKAPGVDRPKTVASKAAAGAREPDKASPQKTASRKGAEKPLREERQAAKEDIRITAKDTREIPPGARASADAMSGDHQLLDMKPEKHSLR